MKTLSENKFKELLNTAILEIHCSGEVEVLHEKDEEFWFTYDVINDKIIAQGNIELNEGQVKQICTEAYIFHQEQPEESNLSFPYIKDMYSETGTNPEMFI